jgi:hypothetical protein
MDNLFSGVESIWILYGLILLVGIVLKQFYKALFFGAVILTINVLYYHHDKALTVIIFTGFLLLNLYFFIRYDKRGNWVTKTSTEKKIKED